jgi:signal transduction histidine kinase
VVEEFEKTDLNKILDDVKSDFELLIKERNAKIEAGKLPVIYGVPLQLHQLFSNLISNSIKFCEHEPHIKISSGILTKEELKKHRFLNPMQAYVALEFKDNGIGFEQEYGEKIFEVFQRLHEKQSYKGTGVGLALCKKIVANHHGFIMARGKPGKGSVFYVYLPINEKQNNPDNQDSLTKFN